MGERSGTGAAPRVASRARLVGRDRELHELRAALEDAEQGRGRVVLVAGDAGIGKTRLVDEATASCGMVLWGRCWESGGAPPYWPWIQVVRRLAQMRSDADLVADAVVGTAELVALVPELGRRLPDAGPPSEQDDPEASRFRVCDAVASLLWAVSARAAQRGPVVVVLDDLHAADESSLVLLNLVARDVRGHPVLVVGTYREDEARGRPAVHRWLTQIGRDSELLRPQPLSRGDVAELIEDRFVVAQPADVATRIHDVTAGNPLFVTEMLRLVELRGVDAGFEDVGIPDSVRHALRLRIQALPTSAREALGGAAVLGTTFDRALVERVTRLDPGVLTAALDVAGGAGLVEGVRARGDRFRFAHALLRDTVYDDLPLERRHALHRRAAHALAARHPGDGRRAAEIAHHLLRGGPDVAPEEIIGWLRRSAEHAAAQHAHLDAVAAYETAVDLAGEGAASALQRPPLLCALAEALHAAGNDEAALERFEQARALADAAGDIATFARATIGWCDAHLGGGGDLGTRLPVLHDAIARTHARDPAAESRLHLRIGSDYLSALRLGMDVGGDPHALSAAAYAEAVAAAERAGDPDLLVETRLAATAAQPEHGPAAVDVAGELVALADAGGNIVLRCRTRVLLVAAHLRVGAVDAVDRVTADAHRLAVASRRPFLVGWTTETRAARALMAGRLAEAAVLVDELLGGTPFQRARATGLEFLLALERDEVIANETRWRVEQGALNQLLVRTEHAVVAAEAGRVEHARTTLRRLLDDPFVGRAAEQPHPWTATVAQLAELAALVDDAEAAVRLTPLLEPIADRVACYAGLFAVAPVSYELGLLAAVRREWAEAVRWHEQAVAANLRMRADAWLAWSRWRLAQALRGRRGAGDLRRADALVAEARAAAEVLGQRRLLRMLDAEASPHGAFTREGDVWKVAFGRDAFVLRHTKGLHHVATLTAHPGVEIPALDLVGLAEGEAPGPWRAAAGDAGPALDAAAKAAYRRRVDELRTVRAKAAAAGDDARAAEADAELQFLLRELAAAVGLGGRDRPAASAEERARQTVQKAVRAAIDRITEQDAALGAHLRAAIRTGRTCVYEPADPVRWLHSM